MKEIDAAARVIRAGSVSSETSKKLRVAVWKVIEFITDHLDEEQKRVMWGPTNWTFWRMNNSQCKAKFRLMGKNEYEVITNSNESQYLATTAFCYALVGPDGQRLLKWIESRIQSQQELIAMLAFVVPREQKDKTFLVLKMLDGHMNVARWSGDVVEDQIRTEFDISTDYVHNLVQNGKAGENFLSGAHGLVVFRER